MLQTTVSMHDYVAFLDTKAIVTPALKKSLPDKPNP
jgi:hypothetical protein